MKELTKKQSMFVKEYLIDLNATQSAIRAGYSAKTAQRIGSENLSKPLIEAAIQKAINERAAKVDVTAEDVLESIKRIRNMTEAGEKWSDALRANELLGKHLKLFTDKHEHSGPDGEPIQVVERLIVEATNKDG